MNSVVSYFASHKPSTEELENCRRIVISSDIPRDPNDLSWEQQEKTMDQGVVQISEVPRNGDRNPDVNVIGADLHLLYFGDDWNGDGLDGYEDSVLYCLNDIDCHFVFSLSMDEKRNVITKRRWLGGGVLVWTQRTRHSNVRHREGSEHS
jgi:hypothetical protein